MSLTHMHMGAHMFLRTHTCRLSPGPCIHLTPFHPPQSHCTHSRRPGLPPGHTPPLLGSWAPWQLSLPHRGARAQRPTPHQGACPEPGWTCAGRWSRLTTHTTKLPFLPRCSEGADGPPCASGHQPHLRAQRPCEGHGEGAGVAGRLGGSEPKQKGRAGAGGRGDEGRETESKTETWVHCLHSLQRKAQDGQDSIPAHRKPAVPWEDAGAHIYQTQRTTGLRIGQRTVLPGRGPGVRSPPRFWLHHLWGGPCDRSCIVSFFPGCF